MWNGKTQNINLKKKSMAYNLKSEGGGERGWKVIHKLTLGINRLKNLSNKFKLSEKKLDINFVGWKATSSLYFSSSFRLFDANVNIYLRNTYPFPSAGNFLHNNWLVSAVLKLCKQTRGYMSEHQTTSCYVSSSWGTDLAKIIAIMNAPSSTVSVMRSKISRVNGQKN